MSRIHYMHVWKCYDEMLTLCHYENPVFDTKKVTVKNSPSASLPPPPTSTAGSLFTICPQPS